MGLDQLELGRIREELDAGFAVREATTRALVSTGPTITAALACGGEVHVLIAGENAENDEVGQLSLREAALVVLLFGGEGGVSGNRVAGPARFGITFGPQIQLYYLIALYTFICTALMFAFTRTPLGRMLNAVRDNPERVEFIGYSTQHVRYLAFMISGFFAGISGGLGALNFEIVTAEAVGAARQFLDVDALAERHAAFFQRSGWREGFRWRSSFSVSGCMRTASTSLKR